MRNNWKTLAFVVVFAVSGLVSGAARADDDVQILGDWTWDSLGDFEPRAGQVVAMSFDGEQATITVSIDGRSMVWHVGYTAEDGTLTLQPTVGLGEAKPSTIKYHFDDGMLVFDAEGEEGTPMVFRRAASE